MLRRRFLSRAIGGMLVVAPCLPGCGGSTSSSSAPPAAAGIPINRGPAGPPQKKGKRAGARPAGPA